MKKVILSLGILSAFTFISCSSDDDSGSSEPVVDPPAAYVFTREGASTVSYSGQTTRIAMAEELVSALKTPSFTEAQLDGMFDHTEGDADFSDADLNASSKNVRAKSAASNDFFASNTTDANAIKADFDSWIANQVDEVYPNWGTVAAAGTAGSIDEAGAGSTRYVNAKGLEYNQAFTKSLIGALMTDQMLNNYSGTGVLDAGTNRDDNDAGTLASGKNYTTMEHKWDEAFGYLYGADVAASPVLGADSFLNKYLDKVNEDSDFAGIATTIYDAFKRGRQAIVVKNYTVRDEQANIIRENVSKIIGIRAVYYLQAGKSALDASDNGSAFHDLSEGFGFIYSLQFTRKPGTNEPYFTKTQVDAYLAQLMTGDGFWDVTGATLDTMSNEIAAEFDFTVAQADN